MTTYSDIVKNPKIPRENAASQVNNKNKRRVYNKSDTQRKKSTNTRQPKQPPSSQPPISFNLFLGNMGEKGMPQILADRALLGLMNAQNIPNGVQNPGNPLPNPPVPPVPPPAAGHILGGGFNAEDRQQLQDVVDAQRVFFEEQNNIRREINANAFNLERQNELRDDLIANQNNSRAYLELVSNQTQASLADLRQESFSTSMNVIASRRLVERVNNRTTDLETSINTTREEHKKNMEKIQTMFNMLLTPGSDRKALNDAYNKNREELRNNPERFLDVIFANKDRGAPRLSPQNDEDMEAGARMRPQTPPGTPFDTPQTDFSQRTGKKPQGINFSQRLDMAAGGYDSGENEQNFNARHELGAENSTAYDTSEDERDFNARHELGSQTGIYVNAKPQQQRFTFLKDDDVTIQTTKAEIMPSKYKNIDQDVETSQISDEGRPRTNNSGMFIDDDTDA